MNDPDITCLSGAKRARQLPTKLVEKVWGRERLPEPFMAPECQRIGEIWFEPPAELPDVLVKYLFTNEKLSVQVHPSDLNAIEGEAGKEECWLVLDAEPGASLAIGFNEEIDPERVASAAKDGSIEKLLTWHPASPGDIFHLPPGTVHAIGPGLALLEVQQSSDTTFRMYDYGRPRELHLERAMAVADCVPYDKRFFARASERGNTLVDGAYFRLDRVEGVPSPRLRKDYPSGLLALPLEGEVKASEARAGAGECLFAHSIDEIDFSKADVTLLARSGS